MLTEPKLKIWEYYFKKDSKNILVVDNVQGGHGMNTTFITMGSRYQCNISNKRVQEFFKIESRFKVICRIFSIIKYSFIKYSLILDTGYLENYCETVAENGQNDIAIMTLDWKIDRSKLEHVKPASKNKDYAWTEITVKPIQFV